MFRPFISFIILFFLTVKFSFCQPSKKVVDSVNEENIDYYYDYKPYYLDNIKSKPKRVKIYSLDENDSDDIKVSVDGDSLYFYLDAIFDYKGRVIDIKEENKNRSKLFFYGDKGELLIYKEEWDNYNGERLKTIHRWDYLSNGLIKFKYSTYYVNDSLEYEYGAVSKYTMGDKFVFKNTVRMLDQYNYSDIEVFKTKFDMKTGNLLEYSTLEDGWSEPRYKGVYGYNKEGEMAYEDIKMKSTSYQTKFVYKNGKCYKEICDHSFNDHTILIRDWSKDREVTWEYLRVIGDYDNSNKEDIPKKFLWKSEVKEFDVYGNEILDSVYAPRYYDTDLTNYKYDEFGNWIEKKRMSTYENFFTKEKKGPKQREYFVREIEYINGDVDFSVEKKLGLDEDLVLKLKMEKYLNSKFVD